MSVGIYFYKHQDYHAIGGAEKFVETPMTEKNKFPIPFLMSAEKAAKIIIDGIKKEKRTIQFPLPTVLSAKLMRIVPEFLFEYISRKKLREK